MSFNSNANVEPRSLFPLAARDPNQVSRNTKFRLPAPPPRSTSRSPANASSFALPRPPRQSPSRSVSAPTAVDPVSPTPTIERPSTTLSDSSKLEEPGAPPYDFSSLIEPVWLSYKEPSEVELDARQALSQRMWDVLYRESYEDTPQKTELIPNAVSSSPTPVVPLFAFEEQLPILPEPDEREEIVTKRKRKTRRGKRKRVTVAMEEENISECHRRMEERSASPGVVEPTSYRSAFTLPLPPQQYEETSCGLMSSVARPTVEMEVDNSFVAVEEDVSLFATDGEAPHCLSASAEVSPHMLFDAYEEAPQSLWAVLVESPRALTAWAEETPSVLTAYEEEHPKVIYAELCESPVEKRPSQLSQEEIRHYVMERLDRGRFSWVLHAEEVCQQQQQQEAPRAVSPSVCGFNLPSHSFSQMDVDGGEATASPPGDSSLYSMPRLYSVSPAPRPPSVEAVPAERSLPQPVSPAPTHTATTVPKKKIRKRKVVLPGKVRSVPHSTWKATTAAKRETPSTTTEFVKPRQSVLLRKCPFATQNNNIPQPSGKEKELARKASTHRNLQATKNHSRTEKGKKSFAPKKRP